ncbi:lasso peptide biosynthesis B2 protein [Sphingosinicella xenopeptidilytica]|uniref:Lasso peptide biosynthesis B2 protein n=2 Tax=Sphingosinicella xenopeptidilytica TaxID=364098 RepID=A0ABW3C761_SPHXN
MAMTYALRPGLHWREIEDHVFFLDIPADRYFCLKGSAAHAFMAAAHGDMPSEHGPAARALLNCGIIRHARRCEIPPPCSVVGVTSEWPATRLRLSDIAHGLVANVTARRRARMPLQRLITDMVRRKTDLRPSSSPETDLGEIVAVFRLFDRVFSGQDQCLPRAAAILGLMLRKGASGDFVIGLSLHPFRAHAWIQVGDRVVGDRADIVTLYAPILAI